MKYGILIGLTALVCGCASYSGSGLVPGKDGLNEVVRTMGEPAMRWNNPDGSVQLSYPRGPASPESFMVNIAPDGKLRSIGNVLNSETLSMIKPGMSKQDVLRLIGPSDAAGTAFFPQRNELALEWRYEVNHDDARFVVLFDATKETVRSTMTLIDAKPSML